jgi:hypothetical protein
MRTATTWQMAPFPSGWVERLCQPRRKPLAPGQGLELERGLGLERFAAGGDSSGGVLQFADEEREGT